MSELNPIAAMRKVYQLQSLLEEDVDPDPLKQFGTWWKQAVNASIEEPNAMTLATATLSGRPSARIVLLKAIQGKGFVFFTNYLSRKGTEIDENPFVSLLFFWKELERQVRIEGKITKTSTEESDAYFFSRPLESRIGAWSSPQSSVIESRKFLEENAEKFREEFGTENVPRPDFWGGYLVEPHAIEFWQGRPGRLHDRIRYFLDEKESWTIERLAP